MIIGNTMPGFFFRSFLLKYPITLELTIFSWILPSAIAPVIQRVKIGEIGA
jgi:hypothetical protein